MQTIIDLPGRLLEDLLLVRYKMVIEGRWHHRERIGLAIMEGLASTWSHFWPVVVADEYTFDFIMVIEYFLSSKNCAVIRACPFLHSSNSKAGLDVNCPVSLNFAFRHSFDFVPAPTSTLSIQIGLNFPSLTQIHFQIAMRLLHSTSILDPRISSLAITLISSCMRPPSVLYR